MTATTSVVDGKPRKQLSDQIDRLEELLARQDVLIDGFAAALNEAVADAVKEGVKEAVTLLLGKVELRAGLQTAAGGAAPSRPSAWSRLKEKMRQAAARVRSKVTAAAEAVAAAAARAGTAVGRVLARARQSNLVRAAARILVAAVSLAIAARFAVGGRVVALVAAARLRVATGIDWVRSRVRAGAVRWSTA